MKKKLISVGLLCLSILVLEGCTKNKENTNSDSQHQHHYEVVKIVSPTCSAEGYTIYSCTDCHQSYEGDYVPMIEHVAGEWEVIKEASCVETGIKQKKCVNCDAVIESQEIPVNDNHQYGSYVSNHNQTHTRICNHHGEVKEVSACSYTGTVIPPTCSEKGYTIYKCIYCQDSYQDQYVDTIPHNLEQTWQVHTPATCVQKEILIRHCQDCDYYETKESSAPYAAHQYEVVEELNGRKKYECKVCHDSYYSLIEEEKPDWGNGDGEDF